MTYYDIYLSALAFIGEPEDSTGTADYKKRALLLLPHIVSSLTYVQKLLGNNNAPEISNFFYITLDSDFPLDEQLATVASAKLASLLVIDELPEMSQTLSKRAAEELERIMSSVVVIGSTREVY